MSLWMLGFLLLLIARESFLISDEKKLIRKLLQNYNQVGKIGRPVKNHTDKITIAYGMTLTQILDLDEKNQILTINVWNNYEWRDHLLRWDPDEYSGIKIVQIPQENIWTPDIVLYNYADERLKELRATYITLHYDGKINWIPTGIFKSSCKIDIKIFPFDWQGCHLKFGSWTYNGDQLDVIFYGNNTIDMTAYTPSNEWEVLRTLAVKNSVFYSCCPYPFVDLTFFLFLKRNPAFFSYLLVLPCVLLSSLTLIIFWLPPESPAKMQLGLNIFVAFFLLLLLLADSTPSASTNVPYIGYYYCLNMVLITMSSFLSTIVINLNNRGDKKHRVSKGLRKFFYAISYILCMNDQFINMKQEKIKVIRSEIKNNRKYKQRQVVRFGQMNEGRTSLDAAAGTLVTTTTGGDGEHTSNSTGKKHSGTTGAQQHANSSASPSHVAAGEMTSGTINRKREDEQGLILANADTLNEELEAVNHDEKQCEQHFPNGNAGKSHKKSRHRNHSQQNHHQQYAQQDQQHGRHSSQNGRVKHVAHDVGQSNEFALEKMQPQANSAFEHQMLKFCRCVETDLGEIRRSITVLMDRITDTDTHKMITQEWRMIAMVLDRIFFWMYFFIINISAFVLLMPKKSNRTDEDVIKEHYHGIQNRPNKTTLASTTLMSTTEPYWYKDNNEP